MKNNLVVALLLAASCNETRTMLVVEIGSNLRVPDELSKVEVVVKHGAEIRQRLPFSLREYKLPLQVGLVSVEDLKSEEIEIIATGFRDDEKIVVEEAIVAFIEGESALLRLYLARECRGVSCDPTRTCTLGGNCRTKQRAVSELEVVGTMSGTGSGTGMAMSDAGVGGVSAVDARPVLVDTRMPASIDSGVLKRPNGAACTGVGDCMSGFCVGSPGRCCIEACDNPCKVCGTGYCENTTVRTRCAPTLCDGRSDAPIGTTGCIVTSFTCEVGTGACISSTPFDLCKQFSCQGCIFTQNNGIESGVSKMCSSNQRCVAGSCK